MKKFLLALILCLVAYAAEGAAAADEIPTLDKAGLASLIQENRGKVIMFNFFATWCPPCRAEMPELVKLRLAYPEKEFMLFGLSVDEDKSAVPPFAKLAGVNYPIYMAGKDVTDEFNVSSVPHNAFLTRKGEVIISEPGMANTEVLEKVVNDLLEAK